MHNIEYSVIGGMFVFWTGIAALIMWLFSTTELEQRTGVSAEAFSYIFMGFWIISSWAINKFIRSVYDRMSEEVYLSVLTTIANRKIDE